MRELIVKKSEENIGALCGFLKSPRNIQYLEFVINNIPKNRAYPESFKNYLKKKYQRYKRRSLKRDKK